MNPIIDETIFYKIIADCAMKPVEDVSAKTSLLWDLLVDSLMLADIISQLEGEFCVSIPESKIHNDLLAGELYRLVEELKAKSNK